jgi:hypothetical protein
MATKLWGARASVRLRKSNRGWSASASNRQNARASHNDSTPISRGMSAFRRQRIGRASTARASPIEGLVAGAKKVLHVDGRLPGDVPGSRSGASRTRTGDLLGAITPQPDSLALPLLAQALSGAGSSKTFSQFGSTVGSTDATHVEQRSDRRLGSDLKRIRAGRL